MFDELTDDELETASGQAAAAGLYAARLSAAERLVNGPGSGAGKPNSVVEALMARDRIDPRYERLEPWEQRWALLVIRIAAPVMDPVTAIADARRRGLSWAAIGGALGVSAQSAHTRFAARVP